MRILQVTMRNLNSLRGEHTIDLAAEPLGSAGIFATTGPTGAGKSTILDAITLALYGRAARYGTESNPAHMMSRHTGECSAEVRFEIPGGCYRATWQLRRARGKPDGKLQSARRFLYDDAGQVLAEQLREADRKIEDLCGLDYDRFMRSVLLAQGEFARFLKAKDDERAALLESLTGTDIYSRLSMLAHEEWRRRRADLEAKELALGQMKVLSEDERASREEAIAKAEADGKLAKVAQDRLSATINRSGELLKHLANEVGAEDQRAQLARRREAAADDLAKLANHAAAVPFLPALGRAEDAESAWERRKSELAEAEESLKVAEEAVAAAVQAAAEMATDSLAEKDGAVRKAAGEIADRRAAIEAAETWLERNAGDRGLAAAFTPIAEGIAELVNCRALLAGAKRDADSLGVEMKNESERHGVLQGQLAAEAKASAEKSGEAKAARAALDAILSGEKPSALRKRLDALKDQIREIGEVRDLAAQCGGERANLARAEAEIARLEPLLKAQESDLQRAVDEESHARKLLRSYHDHLVTAQRVASLESQRSLLVDGEPCPLCGAQAHPYATGAGAPPELQDLQARAAGAEAEAARLAQVVTAARTTLTKSEAELSNGRGRAAESRARSEELAGRAAAKASPLGLQAADADTIAEALARAQDAVTKLGAQLEKIDAVEEACALAEKAEAVSVAAAGRAELAEAACLEAVRKIEARVGSQRGRVDSCVARLAECGRRLAELLEPYAVTVPDEGDEAEAKAALAERRDAYTGAEEKRREAGTALKDAEAAAAEAENERARVAAIHGRLVSRREAAGLAPPQIPGGRVEQLRRGWSDLEEAQVALGELERAVERAQATVGERQKAVAGAREDYSTAQSVLAARLDGSAFADAATLRAARLDAADEHRLAALRSELEDAEKSLAGQLLTTRQSIARLRGEETAEGGELERLRAEKSEIDERVRALTGELAMLKDELARDDQTRQKLADQASALDAERGRMRGWDLLQGLIGSHDGRKFRRFAQGISLDVLIRHANRHLDRLSERYQLRRTDGQELETEIIDLYQAGVSRPMSSLSGGESFLASLALALGLSDLAGRNVQIDSLFIDEGFGSLDPETLDIALSALEILRMHNKTVGVISHVELLKDRISTQIEVRRLPGGMSTLKVLPEVGLGDSSFKFQVSSG
ncbi:AAA family ATPase [soil metagenome]